MIPQTEIELETWMKRHCYNFNSYSINGNAIYEGFGIDKTKGEYIWYYTESGIKENIKIFNTEKELIAYTFDQIQSDKWAKTHCIGMTTSKEEKMELSEELRKREIKFIQDEIPYFGPKRPAYRTFVLGCDKLKTKDLKRKYFKTL
ncbi:hypothetical protein SAMN05421766_10828 [Zobellia uliginosa]|uniref:Uncharacterized protein n=1 Tax=Zobellia uliginosa TaxID=143224 RepID=A0ABY1L0X3_9FLAO|nr:hypothetical protein [Zobellia uliginosa]SIT05350.1 hypothetical protein SAMN05421766_10828 [Zobellia uliginosa]